MWRTSSKPCLSLTAFISLIFTCTFASVTLADTIVVLLFVVVLEMVSINESIIEICWRLPGEYGSYEDSPLVPVECSKTPIRLPGTSTSNVNTCTSTLVVSTGVGFVGPGGCPIQDTEHWCRGSRVSR